MSRSLQTKIDELTEGEIARVLDLVEVNWRKWYQNAEHGLRCFADEEPEAVRAAIDQVLS